MSEELKRLEAEEEAVEELEEDLEEEETSAETGNPDADIDRYIQELTGKAVPQKEEPKEEPEVEHFRVMSQIGEDDHKAFIWFSTLLRHKWVIPSFIIVPIIFSVLFAFNEGEFYSGNLILSLVVMYLALTLIVVIRCNRWISKIRKNSPKSLYLTDTTLIFLTRSVVHLKNENRSKVSYAHMIGTGESKKHFYMYFDSGKSMVFRKEDMPADVLAEFRPFIQSKVHKRSLKDALKNR